MQIGDRIDVDVTAIAHGGHCVARHEGQVIFVRHAIPGERVTVEITDITRSFARGNCVVVIDSSPHRVKAPCKRLAKIEVEVDVEEVLPTLHWRNRMEFTVSDNSKLGLFASRSSQIVEIEQCLIASTEIDIPMINQRRLPKGKRVDVAITSSGSQEISIEGRENFALIKEKVGDVEFSLNPLSFWQSHKAAPELLSRVVRELSDPQPGDHVFDLYGGVGLFAAALLPEVGAGGRITIIESDDNAITDAKRNFAEEDRVEVVHGRVEKALKKYVAANLVILDPPRSGAGASVIEAVVSLKPRAIVYVACDPASLARDTAYLKERGFALHTLRAFDLFPMTAHMECVARFIPE
jgi:tRNA/tmRNA/rRNA uracil-C5-methylase (TrmA/RlmC/RlmD family)